MLGSVYLTQIFINHKSEKTVYKKYINVFAHTNNKFCAGFFLALFSVFPKV